MVFQKVKLQKITIAHTHYLHVALPALDRSDREASKRTARAMERTVDYRTEFLLEFQGSKRPFGVTTLFKKHVKWSSAN